MEKQVWKFLCWLVVPLLRKIHTAVKNCSELQRAGGVRKDASINTFIVSQLMSEKGHYNFVAEINAEYQTLRDKANRKVDLLSLEEAKNVNLICSEPCFYFKRKLFPFCWLVCYSLPVKMKQEIKTNSAYITDIFEYVYAPGQHASLAKLPT